MERIAGENYTYELNEIERSNNLKELIESADNNAIKKGSSFISKKAAWKYQDATMCQMKACKGKEVKTKWEAQ